MPKVEGSGPWQKDCGVGDARTSSGTPEGCDDGLRLRCEERRRRLDAKSEDDDEEGLRRWSCVESDFSALYPESTGEHTIGGTIRTSVSFMTCK